ncbi:MAG: hypothetical protein IJ188_03095 [Clostridia bacterium]|nr:hypothetical protein [Clostridia bacterium]
MALFDIMDDPRIRETEMFGMPEGPEVLCPICGKATDTFYRGRDGDIFACNNCLTSVDAFDYADRHGWFELAYE